MFLRYSSRIKYFTGYKNIVSIFSPDYILATFGILGAASVVFAETGLFFGFFLPGDTLLLAAGIFAAHGYANVFVVGIAIFIAAVVGDSVGFASGRKAGELWFNKKESFFFKRGYLERSGKFFNRFGAATIVIARFVPIVRTFAPILAGISRMEYRTFFFYNVLGAFIWTFMVVGLGYIIGENLPKNVGIRISVGLFLLASVLTPFVLYFLKRFLSGKATKQGDEIQKNPKARV